jgi:hypothetical protein
MDECSQLTSIVIPLKYHRRRLVSSVSEWLWGVAYDAGRLLAVQFSSNPLVFEPFVS